MKLFKGILAVALIAMVVVSCDTKTKDKPNAEQTETVEKDGKKAQKCGDDCKKKCCAAKGEAHKCADAKCSKDCKIENCPKCAVKHAECKAKCAKKHAEDKVEEGTEKVKEGTEKVVDEAKKGVDEVKKAVN